MDGTENIYQITGTTTIANNEMSGGAGYLTTAFDNSVNWEITFKAKWSNGTCAVGLIAPETTQRDTNMLSILYNRVYAHTTSTHNFVQYNSSGIATNTYHTFKITKNGSTVTVTIDDQYSPSIEWSPVTTFDTLCIGVDTWGGSPGTATIKDIIVKPL